MRIEHLLHPVESYLHSRAAILRALDKQALNPKELGDLLLLKYRSVTRRRQNASQWRPDELGKVALLLRMSTEGILGLKQVAPRLMALPQGVRGPFLKDSQLSLRRLQLREENVDLWQYNELEQLAVACRKWQDTKKLDRLLSTVGQ